VHKDKVYGTILYLPKEQKTNSPINEPENILMHQMQVNSSGEPFSGIYRLLGLCLFTFGGEGKCSVKAVLSPSFLRKLWCRLTFQFNLVHKTREAGAACTQKL
jgi:hypothetical protein